MLLEEAKKLQSLMDDHKADAPAKAAAPAAAKKGKAAVTDGSDIDPGTRLEQV
jgi:hypothetical protein